METQLEHILSSSYKDNMISWLNAHQEYFVEAIELAISDKQPYAWRSAFLLWSCMEENDPRIRSYVNQIINVLPEKDDGHQRELLKILLLMELDEEEEGILFDTCMKIWEKLKSRPSIRYTAFVFMVKMVNKYPELFNEISYLTEDHYINSLSPGIKMAISRMANGLNKNFRKN